MSVPSPTGHSTAKAAREQFDDAFDVDLTPVEDAEPGGSDETQSDAAAAALRMDMLGLAEEGAGAPPKRSPVNSHNLLLLLVLLAAGGALLAMRLLGMGPRSSLADVFKDPNYDVETRSRFDSTAHQNVLVNLSASRIVAQVPSDQVQRNPFVMEGVLKEKTAPAADASETAAERAAREEAERRRREQETKQQQIVTALATLSVNSVLVGNVPVARINGEMVRIGDTVADVFTVKDIHGRGVVLEADGKTYSIDIPEGHGPSAGPPRRPLPPPPNPPHR